MKYQAFEMKNCYKKKSQEYQTKLELVFARQCIKFPKFFLLKVQKEYKK